MRNSKIILSRRRFLGAGLGGTFGLSLASALTGLPASFLLNRNVMAAVNGTPKFAIIATSKRGEPLNTNAPMTFASNENDPANFIQHIDPNLGGVSGVVNGQTLTAADIGTRASLKMDEKNYMAARAYTALDQSFLNNLVGFWHNTKSNTHNDLPAVLEGQGALRGFNGSGLEQLPSAIAQENATALGTTTYKPFAMSRNMKYQSVPLGQYNPSTVQQTLLDTPDFISKADFSAIYDWSVNQVFKDIKANGTPAQKRFLDEKLISKQNAQQVGEELGALLTDVSGSTVEQQLKVALAMIKIKMTPVVIIENDYGGDNHQDSELIDEATSTLQGLAELDTYWKLLQEYNLQDQVVYASINVFGRTVIRNGAGGRNHYGRHTLGWIHGSHIKGGMVGGFELDGTKHLKVSGINAATGGTDNPTISNEETLAAYLKTIMSACGVSDDRLAVRMRAGAVVNSIF